MKMGSLAREITYLTWINYVFQICFCFMRPFYYFIYLISNIEIKNISVSCVAINSVYVRVIGRQVFETRNLRILT